jgi:hypothetical protein
MAQFSYPSSDTPHHLKNKRVHHNVNDKSSNLLLNSASLKLKESLPPITTMEVGLLAEQNETNDNGDHEQSGKCNFANACSPFHRVIWAVYVVASPFSVTKIPN